MSAGLDRDRTSDRLTRNLHSSVKFDGKSGRFASDFLNMSARWSPAAPCFDLPQCQPVRAPAGSIRACVVKLPSDRFGLARGLVRLQQPVALHMVVTRQFAQAVLAFFCGCSQSVHGEIEHRIVALPYKWRSGPIEGLLSILEPLTGTVISGCVGQINRLVFEWNNVPRGLVRFFVLRPLKVASYTCLWKFLKCESLQHGKCCA